MFSFNLAPDMNSGKSCKIKASFIAVAYCVLGERERERERREREERGGVT